jgi:hypothetical protein
VNEPGQEWSVGCAQQLDLHDFWVAEHLKVFVDAKLIKMNWREGFGWNFYF